MSGVPPRTPLFERDGVPKVYSALGAFFHLDLIEPSDEERLDRVNELVWEWFGPELRWAEAPFWGGIPELRRSDLDYISGYCATLDLPSDPIERTAAMSFPLGREGYSLRCSGGARPSHASPYYYGFWATSCGGPQVWAEATRMPMGAVLSLMVPDDWPHEDFAARVTAIASSLRLRWASAGYTYATWTVYGYQDADELFYKHARRFYGYDVPHYLSSTSLLMNAIRSVNWLTFISPDFATRLARSGRALVSKGLLTVSDVGGLTLIRAGDRPERGDVNRLQVPRAYIEADELLKPVRASGTQAESYVFFGSPWSIAETSDWLQRFGRGGVLPPPPSGEDDIGF